MASNWQPARQYGGGTNNVAALTSRAGEVANRMGGVTPDIWDSVLEQMQQLVQENETLRQTLADNNLEMNEILKKKKKDVEDAQKLYWDARVSVLGFKAQIMKLNGEVDDLRENLDKERRQGGKSNKELLEKFEHEMDELKYTIRKSQDKERQLTQDYHYLKEDKERLVQTYQQEIAHLKSQQKTTPPVPRPRTNPEATQQLQKKINDLEGMLARSQHELSRSRNEFDSLSRQFGDETKSVKAQLRKTEDLLRDKESEIEHLRQQQHDMTPQFDYQVRQATEKLRQTEVQLTDVKALLREKETEIDILKQRDAPAEVSIAGAGGAGAAKMRKALNEEKGKNLKLEKEISYLREEVTSLREQRDDRSNFLESQVQTYKEEKTRQDRELQSLAREKEQLQQQLDEMDQSVHDDYTVLEQNYATLKEENDQLQTDITNLRDQLQNEKERGHQLGVSLSQAESKLDNMRNSSVNDNSSWEGYMEEVEKEMKRVSDDLSTARQNNRSLQAEISQLTKQRTELMEEKGKLVEEKERFEARLNKKTKECNETLDQAQLWKEQFESARHDHDVQIKMRDKEAKAVEALRHNRDSLQKEVDELRRRVTEQQSVIASIDPSMSAGMGLGDMGGPPPRMGGGGSPKNNRRDHHSGEHERKPKFDDGFSNKARTGIIQQPSGRDPYLLRQGPPAKEPLDFGRGPGGPPHGDPRHRGDGRGGPPDDRYRPPGGPDDRHRPPGGPDNRHRPPGGPDDWHRPPGGPDNRHRPPGGPDDRHRSQGGPPPPSDRNRILLPDDRSRFEPPDDRHRHPDDYHQQRSFNPGGGSGSRGGGLTTAPQPYTDFTPLYDRKGGGGGMNDLNAAHPPRQQSGGGELSGSHFRPSREPVSTSPHLGRGQQPRPYQPSNQFPPPDHNSGMTPVRRPMPPDMGGGGGAVPLPGEVPNTSKPTGNCPICNMGNFATQTDLELHAAKCDKFN